MQVVVNEEYARRVINNIKNRIDSLIDEDVKNSINSKIAHLDESKNNTEPESNNPETTVSTSTTEKFLEKEKSPDMLSSLLLNNFIETVNPNNLSQPWTRIDKISQTELLKTYIENNIEESDRLAYSKLVFELLNNKLLNTQKQITYDKVEHKILKIPCILTGENGKFNYIVDKPVKRVSKQSKEPKVKEIESVLCVESDDD